MGEGPSAFVLGAGLGTRLRPLTGNLPKPLVPVWNRPLIEYALDHLIADLAVSRFLVNTHHCPDAYHRTFPEASYRERSLEFRHEPVLLDTAGGLDNIRDWLVPEESLVIYNGDILTDLPLAEAWERHLASGSLATLILRSQGEELRVGFDERSGRVVDLRGALQPDWKSRYQFTGIYFVSPAFLPYLRGGKIESIVFPLLRAIEAGDLIGGFVVDEGSWSDLGERESYLDALLRLASGLRQGEGTRISPTAEIDSTAKIDEVSSIGDGAKIGAGVRICESVVWPSAVVTEGSRLNRTVVTEGKTVDGIFENVDC